MPGSLGVHDVVLGVSTLNAVCGALEYMQTADPIPDGTCLPKGGAELQPDRLVVSAGENCGCVVAPI
jgi:hypothetical protein